MAYIYKITNDINDKIYIGKTELSVEQRFKAHCSDAFRERNEKRPLYAAMRKYGIEHFQCEKIEETNNPEEREKYWIEFYNSYGEGYNATLGGDGKSYINQSDILSLWNQGLGCGQIALQTKHDAGWISKILLQNNISIEDIDKRARLSTAKSVFQIDKISNEIINQFESCTQAAHAMIDSNYSKCKLGTASTHISEVCRDKRKTFAGFIWKYAD